MSAALETESLTPLHWLAILLAVVTGAIHFVLGVQFFPGTQPIAFLLAGLGFFGAVVLFLLDYRRRQLYVAGVPFTALQIVLWWILNQQGGDPAISSIEIIDKGSQVLLIVLLVVLYSRES